MNSEMLSRSFWESVFAVFCSTFSGIDQVPVDQIGDMAGGVVDQNLANIVKRCVILELKIACNTTVAPDTDKLALGVQAMGNVDYSVISFHLLHPETVVDHILCHTLQTFHLLGVHLNTSCRRRSDAADLAE